MKLSVSFGFVGHSMQLQIKKKIPKAEMSHSYTGLVLVSVFLSDPNDLTQIPYSGLST